MTQYVTYRSDGSYRCAVGINSRILITTIIPDTIPNNIPYVNGVKRFDHTIYPMIAANGSLNPLIIAHVNAVQRFPVA